MSKKNKSKTSTKNLVILTALILALVGYFGYRSLLTSPDINLIKDSTGIWKPIPKDLIQSTSQRRTTKSKEEKENTGDPKLEQDRQPNTGRSGR